MVTFDFNTDEESRQFCDTIAEQMAAQYRISKDDAIKRINRLWAGNDFLGEDDRYHWLASFWVKHIFSFCEERMQEHDTE